MGDRIELSVRGHLPQIAARELADPGPRLCQRTTHRFKRHLFVLVRTGAAAKIARNDGTSR
jgi:hypothetical protein